MHAVIGPAVEAVQRECGWKKGPANWLSVSSLNCLHFPNFLQQADITFINQKPFTLTLDFTERESLLSKESLKEAVPFPDERIFRGHLPSHI